MYHSGIHTLIVVVGFATCLAPCVLHAAKPLLISDAAAIHDLSKDSRFKIQDSRFTIFRKWPLELDAQVRTSPAMRMIGMPHLAPAGQGRAGQHIITSGKKIPHRERFVGHYSRTSLYERRYPEVRGVLKGARRYLLTESVP